MPGFVVPDFTNIKNGELVLSDRNPDMIKFRAEACEINIHCLANKPNGCQVVLSTVLTQARVLAGGHFKDDFSEAELFFSSRIAGWHVIEIMILIQVFLHQLFNIQKDFLGKHIGFLLRIAFGIDTNNRLGV